MSNNPKSTFNKDQWLTVVLIIVTAVFGYINWLNSSELLAIEQKKFAPVYMYQTYEPPLEIVDTAKSQFIIENVGNQRGHYTYRISSDEFWISAKNKKDKIISDTIGIRPNRADKIAFSIHVPEAIPKPAVAHVKITFETSTGSSFEETCTYHLVNNEKYVLVN